MVADRVATWAKGTSCRRQGGKQGGGGRCGEAGRVRGEEGERGVRYTTGQLERAEAPQEPRVVSVVGGLNEGEEAWNCSQFSSAMQAQISLAMSWRRLLMAVTEAARW